MSPANGKLDWFPLYFQRLKASEAWDMPDYQFCWYFKLLIESADSPLPGYLPGSLDKLWRLAGAKSELYFQKWGGPELVSRLFCRTEIEGQTWIYNKRMLQVIHEQDKKLTRRRKKDTVSLSLSIQELPDWVPEELFREYMVMREKKKKPLTGFAVKLMVSKLDKFRSQGQDIKAILENAITGCWTGVWPVTQVENGKNSTTDKSRENAIPAKKANEDCPNCGGTGWKSVATPGKASRVTRCECRKASTANGAVNRRGDELALSDAPRTTGKDAAAGYDR